MSVAFSPSWQQATDANLSCTTSLTQNLPGGGGHPFIQAVCETLYSCSSIGSQQPVGEKVPGYFRCTDNELLLPLFYNVLLVGYVVFSCWLFVFFLACKSIYTTIFAIYWNCKFSQVRQNVYFGFASYWLL